jgi:inner membrane protein
MGRTAGGSTAARWAGVSPGHTLGGHDPIACWAGASLAGATVPGRRGGVLVLALGEPVRRHYVSPGVSWMLAGLGLLIAEVVVRGAFLMWLGLAACGVGLLTLGADLGFALQVVAFALLGVVSLAVGLRLRQSRTRAVLNSQQAGLAGRSATALAFHGREGRVRLGDSDWPARLPPDVAEPTPGAKLRVVDVEGTVLIVRP